MSVELARLVTGEVVSTLTMQAARVLTDEVKQDVAGLREKLLRLYEGEAHIALGFASWAEYFQAEFDASDATAYRLLQSARVTRQLPIGSCAPPSEGVTRELAPLLDERAHEISEVWDEVVQEHGPTPTAKQVKQVVARHVNPAAEQHHPEPERCPTCGARIPSSRGGRTNTKEHTP